MVNQIILKLKNERVRQGVTLEELSIRSGVSVKHISQIENGKTMPTIGVLDKIANALGLILSLNEQAAASEAVNQ